MKKTTKNNLNRTLLDMYMACPFTNLKEGESFSDELGERYCNECKFGDFCCLPPDEWGKSLRSAMPIDDYDEENENNAEHEEETILDTFCNQCKDENCEECVLLDMFDDDDDEDDINANLIQSISIVVEEGGVVNVNC